MNATNAKPLALTLGEPGGVGLETALAAWRTLRKSGPVFFLIGDARLLRARARRAGIAAEGGGGCSAPKATGVFARALPVLPLEEAGNIADAPGEALRENAAAVIASIETAVHLALAGEAAGVVTLPLQKESLYAAGFAFEGHTDFLAELARAAGYQAQPAMMLTGGGLRAIPVTAHVPLAEVPRRLSAPGIVAQGHIAAQGLRRFFSIAAPRIAVAGLNPHAGEGGRMGAEEETIIAPAIAQMRAEGLDAFGPLPADTMFHEAARARYDVALCMYHDQALIPVKTLDFHGGVNVTLGLPFVRTSPAHGTALDIAGSGKARPKSLLAALRTAARMARAART